MLPHTRMRCARAKTGRALSRTGTARNPTTHTPSCRSRPAGGTSNAMLTAKTPDEMYDTVAWLYGGSGLSEDPAAAAGAIGTAKTRAA